MKISMPAGRDQTDLRFKALADPNRRMLLDLWHAHDGRTLKELAAHLVQYRFGMHCERKDLSKLKSLLETGTSVLQDPYPGGTRQPASD